MLYVSLALPIIFIGKVSFAQLQFIENKGQWNNEVKFMSEAGSGAFYLQKNGFTIAQNNPADIENIKENALSPF